MLARPAPKILSIKDVYALSFFNFLIIGLYNSSANSLLCIISFLTSDLFARVVAPPEVFLKS